MAQDLSSIRDLAKDEQLTVLLATVALHEGETEHWFTTDEGHIAVTVKTHRHKAPITALLPGGSDAGTGPWWIPEIGTEVAIGFDGDYENDAFVIAIYGSKPPVQLAEGKLVVVGTEIHAIAPNGTAHPLALKSDAQSIKDDMSGHVHADPVSGFSGPPLKGDLPHDPVVMSDPTGTQVLKGQ